MRYLICPYICNNKTEYGYCKTTACINPEYNKIYTIFYRKGYGNMSNNKENKVNNKTNNC